MKSVVTIAGHDLSSGAGIAKDLDVFFSLGLYGLSVPTSLVIQGPGGVREVHPVPLTAFRSMLDTVSQDLRPGGFKIGVAWDRPFVEQIGGFLQGFEGLPIVIDPVIAAKNGQRLLSDDGLDAMIALLFPMASLITPNTDEASRIAGEAIEDVDGMKRAAAALFHMGPKSVAVKGGHLKGEPVDVLFDGTDFVVHKKKRLEKVVHGTGCTFSSLILSFLVLGYPLREAFLEAEKIIEGMLKDSFRLDGGGYYYTSLALSAARGNERWNVLRALNEAATRIRQLNIVDLVPEPEITMGYAIRDARCGDDVATFPARAGQKEAAMRIEGVPEFGRSSRVTRSILTYMKHFPHMRACVSIRYGEEILDRARRAGMSALLVGRKGSAGLTKEGKNLGVPPDMLYDIGGAGRPPLIFLFAGEPEELITKMERLRP